MDLTPLGILILVLVAAAVWAVVELALTLRKARSSVEEVTRSANETIEQVQPIISKLDGVMDELQPALKQADPIAAKLDVAVTQANVSLERVNGILGDVSTVSGTAVGVTDAVTKVANNAANSVNGIVSRLAHVPGERGAAKLAPADDASLAGGPASSPHHAKEPTGYVTYGGPKGDDPKDGSPKAQGAAGEGGDATTNEGDAEE